MRKLRFGIVGIGDIVKSTMAPAMLEEPECEVVAGVSRDQGRADEFAATFGAPFAYTDYDEMLANPEVDAVFVGTPNARHADQVVAAAAAGKHVFCDKPLALNVPDAARSVEACEAAGVKIGINFHNRYLPWVQDTKKLVAEGTIGDVLAVEVTASGGLRPPRGWRGDPALAGLGTTNNVGVHAFDFLRFVLDAEPVEVMAMFDNEGGRWEVETQMISLNRFDNGARVFININQSVPNPRNNIVIYGSKGRIVGVNVTRRSAIDGELKVLIGDDESSSETVTTYAATEAFPKAHRRCLAAYTKAVLDGDEPSASGIDGLRSVEYCAALELSVRERRLVELDEVAAKAVL